MKTAVYLVSLIYFVFYAPSLNATPIYRYTDKNGVVHYTSKKPSPNAKPAKLPPINRGDIKLTKRKLISCSSHGGIDCSAGPDRDGSVICRDGFTRASARYRFSCNSPKLEIADISDPGENGEFSVFVRNKKSVAASKPAVFYKPLTGKEVKLKGPSTIEPFGMAEFTYKPNNPEKAPKKKATLAELNITCANCP